MSHSPRSNRRLVAALTASVVVVGGATLASGSATAAPSPHRQLNAAPGAIKAPAGSIGKSGHSRFSGLPSSGRYAFLLRLRTAPTERVFAANRSSGLADAKAAARDHLSTVRSAQSAVIGRLPRNSVVLYRTHALVAGVAVTTNVANLRALRAIPGVAKVYPIAPKSVSNSYAVPLQGAPAVWEGKGDRGQNTSIAIIDTGIDYTHANFGGAGTKAAYQTALTNDTTLGSGFPSAKVIGGYDLVGDSYNADPASAGYQPVPNPDPNPLDCEGHGSHVSGSAAGYGENSDGSTYTGAYNTSTPFNSMRIGPGMAPQAKLYAFKVFGCAGSTNVVGEALDMAADPNGDGDTSDAVDVVNMSLGSDYGSPEDGDSVAANAAVDAGITVAVASGNAGDHIDVGGSPGDANKVITVASSVDAANVVDSLHVSAPANIAGDYAAERSIAYDYATKPDLSGTVARVSQSTNQDGCAPLNAADAAAVNGKIAFVDWDHVDATRRCGSAARAVNLAAAGAKGFIYGDDEEAFSAGITGSAVIPGVLVAKSGADAIRAELVAGHTVTVSGTTANGFRQLFPGDNDKVSSFSSRGLHATGNVKPDVSAVGQSVFSTSVGTGNGGETESGTSMATPMVAGLSALVIASHPDWTPEQVKADIMNTAGQDLNTNGSANPTGSTYAPNRVGAGRIQAQPALDNSVLVYSATDPGSVSASFGPVEVSAPTTLTRTLKVQNTGLSSASYNVTYSAITAIDGVSYSVSPSSVTVGARSTKTVTLTLSIPDPSALNKTADPTTGRTSATTYPLETLSSASGRVLFSPTSGGIPQLRVPVYAAPRPVATMTQPSSLTMPSGATQTATLPLSGGDLGQNGTNGTGNADATDDIFSLAAGFELTATSGVAPQCSASVTYACWRLPEERAGDVKDVGVTSDGQSAYFGITANAPADIPASKIYYQVDIDTTGDLKPDYVLYNSRLGTDDIFVSNLLNLSTGVVVDQELLDNRFGDTDVAAYDSDSLMLPLYLAATIDGKSTGAKIFDPAHPRINYGISTYSAFSNQPLDLVGENSDGTLTGLSANVFTPAVAVTEAGDGPLVDDVNGLELTVTRNAAAYAADKGQGLLMLHFHDANGHKGQVVGLKTASTTALTVSPTAVKRGTPATLTAHVTTVDGVVPTGTVTFKDGSTTVGTGTLDATGTVAVSYTPTSVGTKSLTAVYSGDANYDPSTSAAATLTVSPAASGTTLLVAPKTVVRRHPVTLTASVAHGASDPVPTGTITVKNAAGTTVGTGTLGATGSVKITYTPTSVGKQVLKASYSGDGNYDPSTSGSVTLTVTKAHSHVTEQLKAKGDAGDKVSVKAKVKTDAGVTPTGRVELIVDGKKVDSAKLKDGKAELSFKPKHKGTFHVKVEYAGNGSYTGGSSEKQTYRAR